MRTEEVEPDFFLYIVWEIFTELALLDNDVKRLDLLREMYESFRIDVEFERMIPEIKRSLNCRENPREELRMILETLREEFKNFVWNDEARRIVHFWQNVT